MRCPKCGGKTKVYDSASDDRQAIRRRRCLECHYRYYTAETVIKPWQGVRALSDLKKGGSTTYGE